MFPRPQPVRRPATWPGRRWRALLLGLGLCAATAVQAQPPALQVLHWWTSASERKAADVLARRLGEEGVIWRDAVIPGGAGLGAGKVLRGRVLAGDAPEVTQTIGVGIGEAAEMGLLLQLDGVARAGQWPQALFPTVLDAMQHRQRVMAAPLGIHRINTLFYNRRVFDRLKLVPPGSWNAFDAIAPALQAAGVTPLAQSAEAWQVATLFENLVLAEGGPALHRDLFVRHALPAVDDPRLRAALQRLRALKAHMSTPVVERPWTQTLGRMMRGEAAMMVMGDWAKGELLDAGWTLATDFGCTTAPGTAGQHLYSIDSFTMFAQDYRHAPAQEKLARLLVTPALQAEYNAVKGSVPVRRDADPQRMDACARASWQAFAHEGTVRVPSLVHRMATDEAAKEAIVAELARFFADERVAPAEVQRRLGAIFRVLQTRKPR